MSHLNSQAAIRQLRAIRALVDNTLAMLGDEDEGGAPVGDVCTHPIDQRVIAGVMGDPGRFFCTQCQVEVSGVSA